MKTREYAAEDEGPWNDFVLRHPQGSPFHLTAWKKSLQETFGYPSFCLVAEDERGLRGVLPLFLVESFIVGKALVSSPFAVYGGVLADGAEAAAALKKSLECLARRLDVDYAELRNAYPEQCLGFTRDHSHVTYTQELSSGPSEEIILEAIPRKTRAVIRNALKNSFVTRIQKTDFAAFDRLYAENLQRLGTPCFPAKHFERLIANFGEGVDIREVLLNGKPVAAVMSFHFRDQVLPYYGAADARHKDIAPTSFMYFDELRWAAQNGRRVFDFGRSMKDSGASDFKARWGMKERELPYEFMLLKRKKLPQHRPDNVFIQTYIKMVTLVWKNVPLFVTRKVGPRLIRLVP